MVLLAATGFTTYALTRDPTRLEGIGCYDRASLDANTAIVSSNGRDPLTICAGVWRQGALGAVVPAQLEACVLQTGAIGVFPRSSGGTPAARSASLAYLLRRRICAVRGASRCDTAARTVYLIPAMR